MNEFLIKALKNARISKNLKQSDVAKILGVKNTTISNYEKGVSNPDIQTLLKLCEIYDIDYSALLGESFGISVPGTNFKIKPSDMEHLTKFHQLDAKGQTLINYLIDFELSRVDEIEKLRARTEGNDSHMLAAHHSENPDLSGETMDKSEINDHDLGFLSIE